jgi:hypothetical protein
MNAGFRSTSRRGTALIAVIFMFVLVAATLTALGVLFANEAKRTRSTVAGAQLRQLLLAAMPAASHELDKDGPAARDVVVHTPVDGANLTLHIQPAADQTAHVKVTAKNPSSVAVQTLVYARTANAWQLKSARLGVAP